MNGMTHDDLDLPSNLISGLTSDQVLERVRRWAPLVRLHHTEKHLPDDPERFREISRFRFSRPGRDFGWNKQTRRWEKGDKHDDSYRDIPWDHILPVSEKLLTENDGGTRPFQANLRPRDDANVFGEGSQKGLFLQRRRDLANDASGEPPVDGNAIKAPVYVDIVHEPDKKVVKVLYWFFYELNHYRFLITHEGDWEHITLIFTEDTFRGGKPPEAAWFAQHDSGHPLAFDLLEIWGGTHCVIYVDKAGHPCHAHVKDTASYRLVWKTWEGEMILIPIAKWRNYAGSWGEVGELKFTTGPLGPYFKRYNDQVPIKMINGVPKIRLK